MDLRFGPDLAERIKARGMSLREFSRRTGTSPSLLSKVVRGLRAPPPAHFDRWADALDLKGRQRLEFIESGWLAGSSDHVRALVENLRNQLAARR